MTGLTHQNTFYVCVFSRVYTIDQGFATSELLTFGARYFCVVGPSCVWYSVWQHLWPPPTKCQQHHSPHCDNQGCLQILPNVFLGRGAKSPPLRAIALDDYTIFGTDDFQVFLSACMSVAACPSQRRHSVVWWIDFTFSWIHLNWRVLFFETAQRVVVLICH